MPTLSGGCDPAATGSAAAVEPAALDRGRGYADGKLRPAAGNGKLVVADEAIVLSPNSDQQRGDDCRESQPATPAQLEASVGPCDAERRPHPAGHFDGRLDQKLQAADLVDHRAHMGRTIFGMLAQQPMDQGVDVGVQARQLFVDRRRLFFGHGANRLNRRRSREGGLAGQHRVEQASKRKQIRPGIQRRGMGLLGTHITRRADDHALLGQVRIRCHRPRDAEVEQLDPRVNVSIGLAFQPNIGRFDIAVDQALVVSDRQSFGRFARDAQGLGDGQKLRPPHFAIKRFTLKSAP